MNYNQFVPIEDYKAYGTGMFWCGVVTGFIVTTIAWFIAAAFVLSNISVHNLN